MKTFNNVPNEEVDLVDGRRVFLSRSVAVTALVIGRDEDYDAHVLIGLRGKKLDEPNKWCLPCGYLDWNESIQDAVRREVFEEAGIDLAQLEANGKAILHVVPIAIPSENRQNVTCRFLITIRYLPETHTRFAENDEVMESKWIPLTIEELDRHEWAFQHKEILLNEINRRQYDNFCNDIS